MSDNGWDIVPEISVVKLATKEERAERVEICKNCEKLSSLQMCSICHCFMPLKTYMKSQKCPLNKW